MLVRSPWRERICTSASVMRGRPEGGGAGANATAPPWSEAWRSEEPEGDGEDAAPEGDGEDAAPEDAAPEDAAPEDGEDGSAAATRVSAPPQSVAPPAEANAASAESRGAPRIPTARGAVKRERGAPGDPGRDRGR